MNLLTSIPANVRRWLYAAYALIGPVLVYTASKGWTGDAEYALYVGVGTAFGLTAAANTTATVAQVDDESPTGAVAGADSHLPEGQPVTVQPAASEPTNDSEVL